MVTQAPERLTVFQNLVSSKSVGAQWLHAESGIGNNQAYMCVGMHIKCVLTFSQRDIFNKTLLFIRKYVSVSRVHGESDINITLSGSKLDIS